MIPVIRDFIPDLLAGFLVNLQVAFGATIIGLGIGAPLAFVRDSWPRTQPIVWPFVRLMQSAPAYVIMFFALNVLPLGLSLFGTPVRGLMSVVLAQSAYMSAYVADASYRALQHLRRDEREHALLFLPNLLRGFIVVVMSSGYGAAIGVSEAVAVTVRQAERLHSIGQRVLLFLLVIGFFVVIFGSANVLIRKLMKSLSESAQVRSRHG